MAKNPNQVIFDLQLRHAIGLRRFADSAVEEHKPLLSQNEKEVVGIIALSFKKTSRRRLATLATRGMFDKMIEELAAARSKDLISYGNAIRSSLRSLVDEQFEFQSRALAIASEKKISTARVDEAYGLARESPFFGRNVNMYLTGLRVGDQDRMTAALRMAAHEDASVDQAISSVFGDGKEVAGTFATTEGQGESVIRNAVTHFSSFADSLIYADNPDVVIAERWSSILDGKTSKICRSRDGHLAPVEEGGVVPEELVGPRLDPPMARPPAHRSCRSNMVAVLSLDPTMYIDSFEEWLFNQSEWLQDDLLEKNAALFRSRKLDLSKIAKSYGRPLTLTDLRTYDLRSLADFERP